MDLKRIVLVARAAWKVIKRPDTAFLAASGACAVTLEAYWAFQGITLSTESVALLLFSIFFLALATWIAFRCDDADAWKPFLAATLLSFVGLILFAELWPFYLFPVATGLVSARLFATGAQDETAAATRTRHPDVGTSPSGDGSD